MSAPARHGRPAPSGGFSGPACLRAGGRWHVPVSLILSRHNPERVASRGQASAQPKHHAFCTEAPARTARPSHQLSQPRLSGVLPGSQGRVHVWLRMQRAVLSTGPAEGRRCRVCSEARGAHAAVARGERDLPFSS